MKNKTIYESLQEYLKKTPKEKVIEDWNEFKHLDDEGITVKEFLENQKQETLEEAVKREYDARKFNSDYPFNPQSFILGAKWQQEQDKNLYNEEDLLNFGAFVRIEDRKEKRLFLIQDYFKKWLEQYKNK